MSHYEFRQMRPNEQHDVASLIRESTNCWYEANGRAAIFTGEQSSTKLFCDVYEALDPGCCLLAVVKETGQIAASCFYHSRLTHVSIGIMNVHPGHFGKGLARQLLDRIVRLSDEQNKPMRLVSSAMNLDSFSLYTRGGFMPRQIFQDMTLAIPEEGLAERAIPGIHRVRDAHLDDLQNIVQLEQELCFIEREKDHRFFSR
jgi:GNAT superfamily N-acetyltransferase